MFAGQSPEIKRIRKMISQLSRTNESILIIGESGTGRKTIAQEIHRKSKQKNDPLVLLNCSSVGDTMTDAELFGEKSGLFEKACKGILYLENIDKLHSDYQDKFLNYFKEKCFRRHSTKELVKCTFRVIGATGKLDVTTKSNLRPDLLNWINSFTIHVPPLRKRKQDIIFLFNTFLNELCSLEEREIPAVSQDIFESLLEYEWPGNVVELKNSTKNLFTMSPEDELDINYLPHRVEGHPLESLANDKLVDAVEKVEQFMIEKSLTRFSGNQTKAANALSISEAALRYKMKKYGLNRKKF